ncbi:MAG: AAA family ATPase [Azoarcus sp.]|jgi:putative DNA primase/helicase|nr:AAA family ATPase [Azoarcus sp.]
MANFDGIARGAAFLDQYRERARLPPEPPPDLPPAPPPEYSELTTVNTVQGDSIVPAPVSWLWPGWIAAGKLHILAGAPGTGKTTIAMALAATLSTGRRWPNGEKADPASVLIWSGEDDMKDTLAPRLIASGANMKRIHFVNGVTDEEGRKPFDPARDCALLQHTLAGISEKGQHVGLLIVDPVSMAVAGDSHKNAEVRRGLAPLVEVAEKTHCAVLGITHFTKGTGGNDPIDRITGSLAFAAQARIVMVAAKHRKQEEGERAKRIFCRAKSNIGADGGGYFYDLAQTELAAYPGVFASYALWGDEREGTARDLLALADAAPDDGDGRALSEAKEWLASVLAEGEKPVKEIQGQAKSDCISWRTIERAKDALGVKSVKKEFYGGFWWTLHEEVINTPKTANHRVQYKSFGGLREGNEEQVEDIRAITGDSPNFPRPPNAPKNSPDSKGLAVLGNVINLPVDNLRKDEQVISGTEKQEAAKNPERINGAIGEENKMDNPSCMTLEEEAIIRGWFTDIGETDPETINSAIARCAQDAGARAFFLSKAQARQEPKQEEEP